MSPSTRTVSAGLVVVVAAVVGVAVGAFAGPSPTASAEVTAALSSAQAALSKRQWADVAAALEVALATARSEAPLVVRQAVLIEGRHTGLGVYTPLPPAPSLAASGGGALVTGAALSIYLEVENLGARPTARGPRELSLEVSGTFSARDGDKTEVLGTKNLGTQTLQTWRTTGVHSLGLDVALGKDTPGGAYVVDLEVKDLVGGKSARKAVPFFLVR